MCARDSAKPAPNAPAVAPAKVDPAARGAIAALPVGTVTSRDASGAARFIVGASAMAGTANAAPLASLDAEAAARAHLTRHADLLGLSESVLRAATLQATHRLANGASLVQLGQRVDGLEVFRARASVVLDKSKNLVSIASSLHPSVHGPRNGAAFATSAESAIAAAYRAQTGVAPADVRDAGAKNGDWRGYGVATPPAAMRIRQANARRVFFPEGDRVVPAYHVEILGRMPGTTSNVAHAYVLAADDGRVLYDQSLTDHEAFQYRVWASPTGDHIPMDGPLQDYTPHPTGIPDKLMPGAASPVLIAMEGFNKNPAGVADPWLASDATVTFGNNVHAYTDRDQYVDDAGKTQNDGYDNGDVRADTNGTRLFDRTYDLTQAPNASQDQMKAAVTQIFYVTNWLHDYWYDSGFDEISGVAQDSNYGRGGVEGDPLRAEGQDSADSGQSDNANMSAMSDGTSPIMQMYVWDGVANRQLTTTPGLTFDDALGAAPFGPQTFDLTGAMVLADDGSTALPAGVTTGTGTTTDACQVPTNVAGKIAVIDRGVCTFVSKVDNAQAGGAIGVVLLNNAAGHVAVNASGTDATATIPVIGVSMEDGAKIKAALQAGAVGAEEKRGAEVLHDGTIDNTVVAHEWGHYLHHRLEQCGRSQCNGMSEGWADFDAIMLIVKEGDNLDGTAFPLTQYAGAGLGPNAGYFGIRRAPYSTDFAKNPFTWQHVRKASTLPTTAPLFPASATMSEAHNVGEIWAETLYEGYAAMQMKNVADGSPRTFQEVKRAMANYVVAGMKATPVEASFVDQRDALLSTVWAMGHSEDFAALAGGFAKRGLGIGAVAPPVTSTTLNEMVENFDNKGLIGFVDATLDDGIVSCDHDGVLDAGESGTLTIRVRNGGFKPLTQTHVTVTTTNAAITFDNGGAVTVPALDPYASATVTLTVKAGAALAPRTLLPIAVNVADVDSYKPSVDATANFLVDYDEAQGTSASDDVEATHTPWTFAHGAAALDAWSRTGDATNHLWHGADLDGTSDESLVSPDLVVSATDPFTIAFSHSYHFENTAARGTTPATYWDGGVLEISSDGGTTWVDISTYVDPGYPHALYSSTTDPSTNPLTGRNAWSGDLATATNVSLNLGTQLAGKTVRVRFRIGTDEGTGAAGWNVDSIAFGGITNTPFTSIIDQGAVCDPSHDAGSDGSTTTSDAGTDAADDGGIIVPPDAGDDAGNDAGADTGTDAATDAGHDSGTDAGTDAGHDSGTDSGTDAGHDSGTDAGHDSGTDSGTDAGHDSGTDSGSGSDASTDASTGADAAPHDAGHGDAATDGGDAGPAPGDGGDDGCACSTAVGHSAPNSGATLGLLAGLLVLSRRRRRA